MAISLEPPKISDASNSSYITPVNLLFFTRARTSVNGKPFRLKNPDDSEPIVQRFQDSKALEIRFQKGTAVVMNLQWVPVNVGRLKRESLSDTLKEQLIGLYRSGIDIRIVLDHEKITHLVTESDENPSLELCTALAKEIVIVGPGWIKYVSDNLNEVDRWIRDPEDTDVCFPSTSRANNCYFRPDHRRTSLFSGIVVMAYEDAVRPTLLEQCIIAMGGTFIPIAVGNSSIEYISKEVKKAEFVYIYKTVAFADETVKLCTSIGSESIDLTTLLNFLADVQIDNLKKAVVSLVTTSTLDSISPKKKRLGLKKSKRVDPLEFFDFTSVGSQISSKNSESHSESLCTKNAFEKSTELGKHGMEEDVREVKRFKASTINGISEDNNSQSSSTASNTDITPKELVEKEKEIPKRFIEEDIGQSKKLKIEKVDRKDAVTFRDAIRKAKESATNKVREGLGISQSSEMAEIDVHVSNLAIVEDVNLMRDRERATQLSTESSWVGRKNFKKFKRNLTPVSKVHRFFVGVVNEDDLVVITRPELQFYNFDNEKEKNLRLAADFEGQMGSVRTEVDNLTTEENGLFVSEDSQSRRCLQGSEDMQFQTTKIASFYNDNHGEEEDNDDDDDDGGPKFGFRRQ